MFLRMLPNYASLSPLIPADATAKRVVPNSVFVQRRSLREVAIWLPRPTTAGVACFVRGVVNAVSAVAGSWGTGLSQGRTAPHRHAALHRT